MHAASITIRTAAEADAPRLLEIYAPYVRKTAITFEYELPTEEEFAARIRRVLKRYPYLVAENEGQILGMPMPAPFIHGRPMTGPWSLPSMRTRRKSEWGWAAACMKS